MQDVRAVSARYAAAADFRQPQAVAPPCSPASRAVQQHAAFPEPRGSAPVLELPDKLQFGQSRRSLPPPSFDQLAQDMRLLKKIKNLLGKNFFCTVLRSKCYSRPCMNIHPGVMACFARFCATKRNFTGRTLCTPSKNVFLCRRVKMRVFSQA